MNRRMPGMLLVALGLVVLVAGGHMLCAASRCVGVCLSQRHCTTSGPYPLLGCLGYTQTECTGQKKCYYCDGSWPEAYWVCKTYHAQPGQSPVPCVFTGHAKDCGDRWYNNCKWDTPLKVCYCEAGGVKKGPCSWNECQPPS